MKQKQCQDITAKPGMCVPEIMRCRPHTTHCFGADPATNTIYYLLDHRRLQPPVVFTRLFEIAAL